MRRIFALLFLLVSLSAPVLAQVQSRPTDPPLVTAANESWYLLREPINVAGELYYPAGATVFFNGNTMVRSGHYNGVPIYTDTTIEPFSLMLVPISRGLMQPYEKPRSGALAGTTGSRTPSFPVRGATEPGAVGTGGVAMAAGAPPAPPQSPGAVSVYTPPRPPTAAPRPVGTAGSIVNPNPPMVSLMRPSGNEGIWIAFSGQRWVHRGSAVPLSDAFAQAGEYEGFPVYTRRGEDGVIYLPTRAGLVTPYRRK